MRPGQDGWSRDLSERREEGRETLRERERTLIGDFGEYRLPKGMLLCALHDLTFFPGFHQSLGTITKCHKLLSVTGFPGFLVASGIEANFYIKL